MNSMWWSSHRAPPTHPHPHPHTHTLHLSLLPSYRRRRHTTPSPHLHSRADWTVLPAINVVNVVLFTGDLTLGHRFFGAFLTHHLYLNMLDDTPGPTLGLVVDGREACKKSAGDCLSALIDTSGGSDDEFVQSRAVTSLPPSLPPSTPPSLPSFPISLLRPSLLLSLPIFPMTRLP